MRFFEAIIRNWFPGMILFVSTALVLSLNTTYAAITHPYIQEKATCLFFHNEISSIAFNVIENDFESCSQNEQDLVHYRNWAKKDRAIAAKTGTKVLSQFAESSLEDAVSFTMKQKGTHIFANNLQPKPWLNQLSTQMGWNENVIRATLQNANGRIVPTAQGIFNTPVNVGGLNFTIRGYFNQGSPIMNSIFIP